MRIVKSDTIGLIIDFQEKLFPHMNNKDVLVDKTSRLIEGLKTLGVEIMGTQQYTKGLGDTIPPIKEKIGQIDYFEKKTFSCCGVRDFVERLKQANKTYIIVAGIEAHVCVLQTVIDMFAMRFVPIVVEDCISSRTENDKKIAIDRMRQEGAIITTMESILFELCQTAVAEEFKAISGLVK